VRRAVGGSIHVFHLDPERVRRVIVEHKRRGKPIAPPSSWEVAISRPT
jgi:hypothetical protein